MLNWLENNIGEEDEMRFEIRRRVGYLMCLSMPRESTALGFQERLSYSFVLPHAVLYAIFPQYCA